MGVCPPEHVSAGGAISGDPIGNAGKLCARTSSPAMIALAKTAGSPMTDTDWRSIILFH